MNKPDKLTSKERLQKVFLGEDICTQRGPMISPAYLEKHYAPQLKHGLSQYCQPRRAT
jgi:hypothetical protein